MQLTLDTPGGTYYIRSYEPGKIIINDETIISNVIVSPEQLINPWKIPNFNGLTQKELDTIFALTPEIVLLGTGAQQLFPHIELLSAFYIKKIGLEAMNTAAACRTYNVLMSEGRKVVAALFL